MCLENLIGIRETCSVTTPVSSYYVEDLEGITLKFADSLADEDQDGISLIEKKISLASNIVSDTIQRHFSRDMYTNSLIDYDTLGYQADNLQVINSQASKHGGVRMTINTPRYKEVFIHSVKLWLDAGVTTPINIYNLLTGKVIATKSVTTVAGEMTEVVFDESILTNSQKLDILISYDLSVANNYKTTLNQGCSSCNKTYSNRFINATQVSIDDGDVITSSNLDSENNTSGLVVDYSIKCSMHNFICNNAKIFSLPMWYKVGELLAREAVYSQNDNTVVTIRSEDNEDLEELYGERYKEEIKEVLKRMSTPKNDDCFRCNPPVRRVVEI